MAINWRMFGRNPYLNSYSQPGYQNAMPYGFNADGMTGSGPTGSSPGAGIPQTGTSPETVVRPSWSQRTFGGMQDWAQNNRGSVGMLLGGLAKAVTAGHSTYPSSLYGPVQERPNAAQGIANLGYNAGMNRASGDYLKSGDERHLAFMDPGAANTLRQQRSKQASEEQDLALRSQEYQSRHIDRMMNLQQKYDKMSHDEQMLGQRFDKETELKEVAYNYSKALAEEAANRTDARMYVSNNLQTLRMRELQGYVTGRHSKSLALEVGRLQLGLDKANFSKANVREKAIADINEELAKEIANATYYLEEHGSDMSDEQKNQFLANIANNANATYARDRIRLSDEGGSTIPMLMVKDGKLVRTHTKGPDMSRTPSSPQPAEDDIAALEAAISGPVASGPQTSLADEARATAQASGFQPQDGAKYYGADGRIVTWSAAANDWVE